MPRSQSFINLLILLVFMAGIMFSMPTQAANDIRQLRLSMNGEMTRVVLDMSAPAGFTAQLYENPDRVELNIAGGQWAAPGFTPGDKSVVREFEADGDSIILHLRRQAVIANMFALPKDGGLPDRLVLDLRPATPAQFAMQLGEVSTLGAKSNSLGQQAAKNAKASVTGFLRDKTETKPVAKSDAKTKVDARAEIKKSATPGKKPLVVIDAGHGGQDPGAIGRNSAREKDITLAVARELRDALQASKKYRVIMVRDRDVYLKLADRVKVAQRNKADLFISLHADTVGANSDAELTRGASIYTISDKASDEVAARLAARENKADLIGGKPDIANGAVGTILLDLMNHETMIRSKDFALAISKGFRQHDIIMLQRPLRSAGFAVLKGAEFPSVLIEMGFLSSNKDGNLLLQKSHQQKLARAIMAGVDEFFANDKLASLAE